MRKGDSVSITRKISMLVLIMVILSTMFVGVFSYYLYRRDSIAVSADKAKAIAMSVVSMVDSEQYKEIISTGEKNQHWFDLKTAMDNVKTSTGVMYLYMIEKKVGSDVIYFIEALAPTDEPDLDLGDPESAEYYADEMFDVLSDGKHRVTDLYDAGEYGKMVSGFAPILDSDGTVLGVVGADIILDDIMKATNFFGCMIIACVIVFSIGVWMISGLFIRRSIGRPISALTSASVKISKGDMDVALTSASNDEIGKLTESFKDMVESTKKQVAVLERLAEGDLTAEVIPRSQRDSMTLAMIGTIDNLNAMFSEINTSTQHVSNGADQIATAAQSLAQGAATQSSTIAHLEKAIAQVSEKTGENAAKADKAAGLASTIRDSAEKGSGQMNRMMLAVKEINEASQSISKVIKTIDDIAFQTNILALNAAVEAARAGQHGKGFAVVADEVRNLAVKSAEAAKDTGSLITNSMEKAELGARIADETAASLAEIVSGINESSVIVGEIAKSSSEQNEAIGQINVDIDQVAQIIQQNSATAEESAASSDELNSQSGILRELVARFKLKE